MGGAYPDQETFTESLWELGFESGQTTIDAVCPDTMKFGIQFSKPTDRTARGAIIRIGYRSGGDEYVHRIGFELILCEGDETLLAGCDFRDREDYCWQ